MEEEEEEQSFHAEQTHKLSNNYVTVNEVQEKCNQGYTFADSTEINK